MTDMGSKMPNIAHVVQNGRFHQHTIIEILADVISVRNLPVDRLVVAEKAG